MFLVWLVVAAGVACSATGTPAVSASAARFPVYSDQQAVLFDDTFSPGVFGMGLEDGTDSRFSARAEAAQSIARVRVSTVTRQGDSELPLYTLVLVVVPPPLAGPGSDEPISVDVAPNSPSYALLGGNGSALIGKTFILLWKRYNDSGHIAVHWRAEPDTDAVRAAVGKARALHDLGQ